ncbi:DUF2987 domain-containing protein [Shewanella youngdeokensis]|uniref:DUF2987 domain-containing protein n=1 Tax=Shewanella youngdeokensis TaxID=2999068 RepID=A0ABZ0JVS0_9GAMM|nr:DUF2987 domain-containing protein [Shewanella sp. DAU334]
MKPIQLFSLLLFSCSTVNAEPFSLEYQGFYQRLKQVNSGNYQLVEVAFSVAKSDSCNVIDGTISTEKESYPLTITDDQRVFLPYEAKLKSDRAQINLNVAGDATTCSIEMQVRAKTTKRKYQQTELNQIQAEMNALLSMMQGFPMRYFSDDISGLTFTFNGEAVITLDANQIPVTNSYHLERKQIEQLSSIEFSQPPKVISPWIVK